MCNSCVIVETLRYGFSDQITHRARLRAENVDISYHPQPTATRPISAVELSAYFLGRHSALICPVRAFECWSVNEETTTRRLEDNES
jgi:hypothetical protein